MRSDTQLARLLRLVPYLSANPGVGVADVAAAFGVALVPDCVQVFRREGVIYRRLRGEHPKIETGVAWRTEDDSPTLRAFLACVPRLAR